MKNKKIVIVGSHPSPALAVIDEIRKAKPDWKIYFFGAKHSLTDDKAVSYEYKETRRRKIPFYNIKTGKRSSRQYIVPIGFIQSLVLLMRLRPRAVLAFGGYVGVPVALAASLLRIPVFTHVQTLKLSSADKLIAKFAKKVFISWPQTKQEADSGKVVLTGLPLRKDIFKVKKPEFANNHEKTKKPLLYITGGSQGAHFINKLVENKLNELIKHFYIIHQVGESTKYNDLPGLKKLSGHLYIPIAHISGENIGWILKYADFIVSRAGMNTTAEFLNLNKNALLIPLPMDNREQLQNAKLYQESGLGRIIRQDGLTPDILVKEILKLKNDLEQEKLIIKKITGQELQTTKAAVKIVKQIEKTVDR